MILFSGCIREYKWSFVILSMMVVYMIGMDIALYYHLQDRTPVKVTNVYVNGNHQFQPSSVASSASISNSMEVKSVTGDRSHPTVVQVSHKPIIISPFANPPIKFIMLDHFNLYVATPIAAIFAKITHYHEFLFFITPNMISFIGVIMGFLSARLIASQNRSLNVLAIVAQLMRNFFDALDGIVAKTRLSDPTAMGHWVDGAADTIGITVFFIGLYYHLKGSRKNGYVAVHTNAVRSHKGDIEHDPGLPTSGLNPHKRILVTVGCYAAVICISAVFWNIYVAAYTSLLEEPPRTQEESDLQNAIIQSFIMWFVALFWRLLNSFAMVEILLVAIYFGKLWEFLVWFQYIGFVIMGLLVSFTAIHYCDMTNFIQLTTNLNVPVYQ